MRFTTMIVALLHLLLLTTAINATATTFVETTAILDWDSFNISTDPGMMIEWTSQSTYPYGTNNWSDDIDVIQNYSWGIGESSTKHWVIDGKMGTTTRVDGLYGTNTSNLNRVGDFIVSGSGYLYFSIDYYLEYTVSGAWGETYANVLFKLDGPGEANGWASLGDGNYGDSEYFQYPVTVIEKGTLSINNYYSDGDAGHFQSWVATESYTLTSVPVPEPSTITLLAIGVFAICGKRKLSKIKKTSY